MKVKTDKKRKQNNNNNIIKKTSSFDSYMCTIVDSKAKH